MKSAFSFLVILVFSANVAGQSLYEMPQQQATTRWVTFENTDAQKGAGGMENKGAKGHAFERLKAGESVDLVNFDGSGLVNRIWLTISDRSPEMLRSLKIEMFWDGEENPAVSVPLGDFFGIGLGKKAAFESALFADPEGRSFNCFIPMPFKEKAVIRVTNESKKDLHQIFYEINLLEKSHFQEEVLYFHAYWSRDLETELGKDFVILPKVEGKGRFLGTNIGIFTNELYEDTWWGEGEVKIYLDGDSEYPSLVGSGTEDYVGTAYGQGVFAHQYQGSPVVDVEEGAYAFYRFHIPDPVYFYEDIKVTIQQMGGAPKEKVQELVKNGARLIPVTVDQFPEFTNLLEMDESLVLEDEDFPQGWTNFYRSDDVSATAYFYLDRPGRMLPPLQSIEAKTSNLSSE
ncbi:DUF2961 domain-containing protein [Salinimicrobium sp. CDJ15-81-2]|nr:DUF2961 domain-containing protein [Salinimicrobium nanhaiense]